MQDFPAVFRNGVATNPDTHSARANHAAILKASQEAGYAKVGRETGHDKSWVSRYLNGQGLASMPELLTWLDLCELRIVPAESVGTGNDQALVERAERVLAGLSQLDDVAAQITGQEQEFADALLALAKRALKSMTVKQRERADGNCSQEEG